MAVWSASGNEPTGRDLVVAFTRQSCVPGLMIRLTDLHDCFVNVADELMLAGGWDRDPAAEGMIGVNGVTLGMFTRARGDDFVAQVSFELEASDAGTARDGQIISPPRSRVSLEVALRYVSADRVQRLLGAETSSRASIDLRVIAGEDAETPEMSDLDAAERGARQLVDVVDRHALVTLDQYVGIDAFVRLYRWACPEWERFVVPAVLGAGGRPREAEDWLAHVSRRRRLRGEPPGYPEYAQRLRRWLQDGARVPDESELPPLPEDDWRLPPPDPEIYEPRELGHRPRDFRTESRVGREVIQRLRGQVPRLSRQDQRATLIAELASHAVEKDPIWIELMLDRIARTDQQNVREAGSMVFGGVRLAGSVVKAAVTGADDLLPQTPDWMRAPSNAFQRLVGNPSHWVLIELEPGMGPFLDTVWQSRPVASMPVTELDVWLAWHPAPGTDGSALGAHVGTQLVGTVPQAVAKHYESMIDSTHTAGGWPLISGELARLNSGAHLLQIPVPHVRLV